MAKLTNSYNLEKINPKLAKEWHPTKNGNLTPKDVTPSSAQKVWWICDNNHEWLANISSRSYGAGCPYCSGRAVCRDNCLQTKNPKLSKEWLSFAKIKFSAFVSTSHVFHSSNLIQPTLSQSRFPFTRSYPEDFPGYKPIQIDTRNELKTGESQEIGPYTEKLFPMLLLSIRSGGAIRRPGATQSP